MHVRNGFIAAAAAVLACAGVAVAQDCTGWAAIGDPSPRLSPAMSLDTGRGMTVLFGGASAAVLNSPGTFSSETWEHDGTRWVFRTLDGPPARMNGLLAYDPPRQRTVLVGGTMPTTPTPNPLITWEWDGSVWTQHASAPAVNTSSALEYMPGVGMVLFVPDTGGAAVQIYRWNGAAWSLHSSSTTPPATGTPLDAAYDPIRGKMIITRADSTLEWDGTAFNPIGSTMFNNPREICFVPSRGRVMGFGTVGVLTLWELSDAGWTQVTGLPAGMVVSSPPAGADRLAAEVLPDGRLLVMGGISPDNRRVSSWLLDEVAFLPLERPGPIGADGPAVAFGPVRGVSVVTGGEVAAGVYDDAVWELRGDTWKQRGTHTPGARTGGVMEFHPGIGGLVLAGSFGGDSRTWSYDGETWNAIGAAQAIGPYGAMDWNAATSQLLFHNQSGGSTLAWNGAAWVGTGILAPAGYGGFEFEPVRGQLIGAGFSNGSSPTYRLVGSTWSGFTLIPTARTTPTLVYNGRLGGLLLFGGLNPPSGGGNFPNRTYFLGSQATNWAELNERGPLGRTLAGTSRDTLSERTVMHGGRGMAPFDARYLTRDTWKFATGPAAVAVQPVDVTARAGDAAELFIIAKGGGVLTYRWLRNGEPLEDGPRVSGAHTDTLVITGLEAGDMAEYRCRVSNACAAETSAPARVLVGCTADFNGDGDVGTDQDIEAFFACIGGTCCATCGPQDFNADGDAGTDQDIEAFFRVLGGSGC
ncbi:MAG TPA: immunoglobulin domain-containing protein [Phycisphaerales bacterium]|nr:immunoglobulin domain-containing protein [Phycisphaerales bacterium]